MIGILGLQGDYAAHGKMLDAINTPNRVVKKPEQLTEIDGLIFPGGESTTLIKLMDAWGWWQPLKDFADTKPVFGTCAGMILVAKKVSNPPQKSLNLIDIDVERNGYGRQVDSFEGNGSLRADGQARNMPMIFIRAPRITRMGHGVEILAECRGDVVMARQGHVVVASFHPELSDDLSVHRHFARTVDQRASQRMID